MQHGPPRLTVDVNSVAGYISIGTGIDQEVQVYIPILKLKILDEPEGYCPDALYACSKYVPEMKGVTDKFRDRLSQFHHRESDTALRVFDYARSNYLYGLYNPDNPGHLFVLIQCFGGWWAGIAAQMFAGVLMDWCVAYKTSMEENTGRISAPGKELDLMIGLLACISKSFGISARTPLIPHYPSGSPPDPVALMADAIVTRHPHLRRFREDLMKALRDWHIPKYARTVTKDYKRIWLPHNHIERSRALMDAHLFASTKK
jgi:hypothetical protein